MNRILCNLLCFTGLLIPIESTAQSARVRTLSGELTAAPAAPVGVGIRPGGDSAPKPGQTLPGEDWLTTPPPKPEVGVYHSCQLYVPWNQQQAERAARANPTGPFRDPSKVPGPGQTGTSGERTYLWCRAEAGERGVDLLVNHDETVAKTLGRTLQAHRLLEQTISLDLEIGQKRAALSDDLKQQVARVRDDVRQEIAASAAQRSWTIAGWSIAGALLLTTVTLTTVVVSR